jgi:hypothetical protein
MPTINQLIRKPAPDPPRTVTRCRRCSVPAEARRLHARLHDDAEEAELGAS